MRKQPKRKPHEWMKAEDNLFDRQPVTRLSRPKALLQSQRQTKGVIPGARRRTHAVNNEQHSRALAALLLSCSLPALFALPGCLAMLIS